jgi:hypothetical protein
MPQATVRNPSVGFEGSGLGRAKRVFSGLGWSQPEENGRASVWKARGGGKSRGEADFGHRYPGVLLVFRVRD